MGLTVEVEKKLKDMTLRLQFQTEKQEGITGILGPSGCGKSMTLKCIAGIETPDRGKIVLNGRVLFDSERGIDVKTRERGAGYLFQNYALFPKMTVRENIEIAVRGDRENKRNTADRYLELLRIGDVAGTKPSCLSGGQQQRAALARILASNPDVLMLDEPFSALDTHLKERLQIDLLDILNDYQGEILMVTHSRDEAYRFCGRLEILDQGTVVVSGRTKDVFADPRAVTAARLTGCKNIAAMHRLPGNQIHIPSWDVTLSLNREIPAESDCVGIRAHYLKPLPKKSGPGVMACRWEKVLEDPFEITALTETGVWWKISKEEWETIYRGQMPEFLGFPEESLLFLKES